MISDKTVRVEMTIEEATKFSDSLSDILCIVRGMELAKPKLKGQIWGLEETRDLSIKIKSAIKKAEKSC